MEILIATANPNKARELHEMLRDHHFTWKDLSAFPKGEEVPETGNTFRANACIKARAYALRHGMWSLADDSGLEVDALQGKPGVVSARWAQIHSAGVGTAANNALLLKQLENVPDSKRTARFVCVLALADPHGRIILTARGSAEGKILTQPRGTNGFGYDPLFFVTELNTPMAELDSSRKHTVSHRGNALKRLGGLMRHTGAAA